MPKFKYELNQEVKLVKSGETGTVLGRAEHTDCDDQYRVCYLAADGRQVTVWWEEGLIKAA